LDKRSIVYPFFLPKIVVLQYNDSTIFHLGLQGLLQTFVCYPSSC